MSEVAYDVPNVYVAEVLLSLQASMPKRSLMTSRLVSAGSATFGHSPRQDEVAPVNPLSQDCTAAQDVVASSEVRTPPTSPRRPLHFFIFR